MKAVLESELHGDRFASPAPRPGASRGSTGLRFASPPATGHDDDEEGAAWRLIGAGIQRSLAPALHEEEGRHHGLRVHYQLIDLDEPGGGRTPELIRT